MANGLVGQGGDALQIILIQVTGGAVDARRHSEVARSRAETLRASGPPWEVEERNRGVFLSVAPSVCQRSLG